MSNKKIEDLIPDIQELLVSGVEVPSEIADKFASSMRELLVTRLTRGERKPTLRMSNIGKPDRQLWYELNMPEKAEKMHPNAYLKFLLGDIFEEVILTLAELSGHSVEGRQDEMEIAGIKGHRDCVIDGVTVDAKTASPYSFKKFEDHLTPDNDAFGYTQQIQSYMEAAKDDPIVTDKTRGAFFVGQKVTGDLCLDIHEKTDFPIEDIIEHKKQVVTLPEPPERCYEPEPYGKSGNMALGINCSYCSFKKECYPGLRMFLYSGRPVFLTEVTREPNVPEVPMT